MKIENDKGWIEIIIDDNCTIEKFYKIAGILTTVLNIAFTNKISDLESSYWDFAYKKAELTLHYNTYLGVAIFPKNLTNANSLDNKIIIELSQTLLDDFKKFSDPNNFVSKYFDPEPIQWGLRGDPELWKEMKLKTETIKIPTTAKELEKLLYKLFEDLTGEAPKKGRFIHIKKYETIGMSKGMVCSDFGLKKVLH